MTLDEDSGAPADAEDDVDIMGNCSDVDIIDIGIHDCRNAGSACVTMYNMQVSVALHVSSVKFASS